MASVPGRAAIAACVIFVACGGGADTDEAALPDIPPPETPGLSLADIAGTWNVTSIVEETGDTVTSVLVATADTAGWTLTFPGREPIAMRVLEVAGDSIRAQAGPYESVLNPGVQVLAEATYRLQGDVLTGTFVTHRTTTGADSVLHGRSEGRRSN